MATVAQLRAQLAERGVKAPAKARKAELEQLVAEIEAPEAGALVSELRAQARVVSVFGTKRSWAMVQLPYELAAELLGSVGDSKLARTITAVEGELDRLDEDLSASALAALALRMAYELDDPWNSATSKSQCGKTLLEALEQLRELADDGEEEGDGLDELSARRSERRAG